MGVIVGRFDLCGRHARQRGLSIRFDFSFCLHFSSFCHSRINRERPEFGGVFWRRNLNSQDENKKRRHNTSRWARSNAVELRSSRAVILRQRIDLRRRFVKYDDDQEELPRPPGGVFP